jgi:hypothetical protein
MQLSTALNLPNRQVSAGGLGYGASLSLDFTNGNQTLDSRITFTRASTATRTNRSGVIESVAINGARFDYDPVTFAPKGLLIEEQRTNLMLRSEEYDVSPWTTASPYSVSANSVISPDGTQDADSVILASGQGSFNQNVTRQVVTKAASAIQYTRSTYFKALGATTSVRVQDFGSSSTNAASAVVSLVDGSVVTAPSTVGTFSGASVSVTNAGNGWWRVALTYTTDTHTSVTLRSFPYVGASALTGDGTSGLYIWGAQLEAGAFATSYIPTVASQVTRSADVATMTGTNFSSWYNATEGTFFAEWTIREDVSSVSIYQADDGTANNYMRLRYAGAGNANDNAIAVSGTVQATLGASNQQTLNTTYKNAIAYKLNDFARSASGATVGTDTSGTIPTVTQLNIGKNSSNVEQPNGTIRRIAYYQTRLTNAQLQSLTS